MNCSDKITRLNLNPMATDECITNVIHAADLEVLDLSYTKISDEGVSTLAEAIKNGKMRNLTEITLL